MRRALACAIGGCAGTDRCFDYHQSRHPLFCIQRLWEVHVGDCSYTESARHARTVILSPRRRISWLSVRSVVPEYDFARVPVELVIASESNERSRMCKSGVHFALLCHPDDQNVVGADWYPPTGVAGVARTPAGRRRQICPLCPPRERVGGRGTAGRRSARCCTIRSFESLRTLALASGALAGSFGVLARSPQLTATKSPVSASCVTRYLRRCTDIIGWSNLDQIESPFGSRRSIPPTIGL